MREGGNERKRRQNSFSIESQIYDDEQVPKPPWTLMSSSLKKVK